MFWREKHTGNFLKELLGIACMGIAAALLIVRVQEGSLQRLLYEHDAAVAASLLGQGVTEQTVAEALVCAQKKDTGVEENTVGLAIWRTAPFAADRGKRSVGLREETLSDGEKLLHQIGLSKETDIRFLPAVYEYCVGQKTAVYFGAVFFFALLFGCIFHYLSVRDRVYEEARIAVEHCGEQDFTLRLPELHDGTLYQLFSAINGMAAMLQAKSEAESKVKEFLKATVLDISHQLKTPLAALSLYQEIILKEPDNADTVVTFVEKSRVSLSRMEGLTDSLLKLTRLDAGSVVFSKKLINARELAAEAAAELTDRGECEKKKIILSGDDDVPVYCDRTWSREALGNLIKNALDHTAAGDVITIAWEQTPLAARFSVTDIGEGIAEEDTYHIFKRFYRSSRSQDRQGAGLGLPLVKAIAEGQGGTVSVRSEKGKGTEFVLSFPVKQ